MKIKEESKILEGLVEGMISDPQTNFSISNDPPELEDPKPIVEIDFKKKGKEFRKKARNSILQIIKTLMPEDMINSQYVQDKVSQDAEQLGKLYYQEYLIETTQQIQVDAITRGNFSPRMFEVFATLSKNHSDIAKQISDFQTILRKSYIDIKYDIKNAKQSDQNIIEENSFQALPTPKTDQVFFGTKDLIQLLKSAKVKDSQLKNDESLTNNAPSEPNS